MLPADLLHSDHTAVTDQQERHLKVVPLNAKALAVLWIFFSAQPLSIQLKTARTLESVNCFSALTGAVPLRRMAVILRMNSQS